jgi:hypothetical protein
MKNKITIITDKFEFGKHKGLTIEQVLEEEPHYILWAIRNNVLVFDNSVVSNLIEQLQNGMNECFYCDYNTGPDLDTLHSDWGNRD